MAAKNSVDLETDPRSIIGTRVFDAPRAVDDAFRRHDFVEGDAVFSAWTDPKHLAQWWGPNGFTTTTHSFEFRPGGSWRFVMHGPDGRDYQNRHGGGADVEPVQFTQTVTFEGLGNSQTRLTWRGKFPSAGERARVIREYSADKGLVQTMARLADYVAALAAERA